ncbi:MAG: flavodoxin family protein [Anaerolineae bacterium]|nr:flavodoxin family protein [Anaerolineae bacterium]
MKITILNGNPDAQNTAFDEYLTHLEKILIAKGHTVTALTLREMEIRYCVGCWGCWVKTPGECVAQDDSEQVCRAVIHADRVMMASPVIMGFLSALLKKTMDKIIPIVHPYIVVDQGEAHHLARYEHYPLLSLLLEQTPGTDARDVTIITETFARTSLNMKSRLLFSKLTREPVTDVAAALTQDIARGQIPLPPPHPTTTVPDLVPFSGPVPKRLVVFNGSPRGKKGNTPIMLREFLKGFEAAGGSYEQFDLVHTKEMSQFRQAFAGAEGVWLGFPLYTDMMPGIVKTFIEALEPLVGRAGNPPVGFLVQSGFPEAAHSRYVERYLEKLAARLGCPYAGTIVKGNGEGTRLMPPSSTQGLFTTLNNLGETFGKSGQLDPALLNKLAKPERYPRYLGPVFKLLLQTQYAHTYWDQMLKENGAYDNRFARPYTHS